jgi:hypothetical protein
LLNQQLGQLGQTRPRLPLLLLTGLLGGIHAGAPSRLGISENQFRRRSLREHPVILLLRLASTSRRTQKLKCTRRREAAVVPYSRTVQGYLEFQVD